MSKNWNEIKDKRDACLGLKVFVHDTTGAIKVIYPKAPKWASRAALRIYRDLEKGGMPTKKGISDIVKKTWGWIIADELRKKR